MKILHPPEGIEILPAKKSLRRLVAEHVLTNAQFTLASSFGMLVSTHEVRAGNKIVAYLKAVGNKVAVLPVVTPARFALPGATQFEFEQLLALTQ